MGELLIVSQTSLLLSPKFQLQCAKQVRNDNVHYRALSLAYPPLQFSSANSMLSSPTLSTQKKQYGGRIRASFIPDLGMSMSQKITLGYAALVGAGGLIGSLKSGSKMSLLSGGSSALILFYIYTILPTNPVLASSLGLALAVALTAVMGSRFKKTGKMFPAGLVGFVSFIMSCGYLHGVVRSLR